MKLSRITLSRGITWHTRRVLGASGLDLELNSLGHFEVTENSSTVVFLPGSVESYEVAPEPKPEPLTVVSCPYCEQEVNGKGATCGSRSCRAKLMHARRSADG